MKVPPSGDGGTGGRPAGLVRAPAGLPASFAADKAPVLGAYHFDRASGLLFGMDADRHVAPVCFGCGRPSRTPFCAGIRGHVCRVKRAVEMRQIRERVAPMWSPPGHGLPDDAGDDGVIDGEWRDWP